MVLSPTEVQTSLAEQFLDRNNILQTVESTEIKIKQLTRPGKVFVLGNAGKLLDTRNLTCKSVLLIAIRLL